MATAHTSEWANKVVVCVGGCGGLGSTCARRFHEEGATVIVMDKLVKESPMPESYRAAWKRHEMAGIHCMQVDVGEKDACAEAFAKVAKEHGNVDCLIETSWTWTREGKGALLEAEMEDWTTAMRNVANSALALKHASKYMSKGSSIAICGSLVANRCTPDALGAPYGCAHTAKNQLVREAASALADKGIRVNGVNPSAMKDSPFIQTLAKKLCEGDVDKLYSAFCSPGAPMCATSMRRFGTTDEICNAMMFLCSEKASYITGNCIYADGGYHFGQPMPATK